MREKKIAFVVLLVCLLSPLATLAAPPVPGQASVVPPVEPHFNDYDAAMRINRKAMLNSSNECASATFQNAPSTVVGIGNVHANGASTGSIVNQTEIRSSTIILQTK